MALPTNIFTSVEHFGIGITPNSVRAVLVDRHGKVVNQGEAILPTSFINSDEVDQTALTDTLKKAIVNSGIKHTHAAICFPEKLAYTREYCLPKVSLSEVSEAIGWQLSTIFPFDPNDIYTDWKLLSQTDVELKLVVVAVSKKLLDGIKTACEQAGILPISFESSASVLARSIQSTTATIIIEIDNFGTSATLVQNGVSSLTTTTFFSQASDSQQVITDMVTSIKSIQSKIQPTIDQSTTPFIYITGEKAAPKLAEILSSQLDSQVQMLPIAAIDPAYHGAYSTAVSAIELPESEKSINLMPDKLKQAYKEEAAIIQAVNSLKKGMIGSLPTALFACSLYIVSLILTQNAGKNLETTVVPPQVSYATLNVPLAVQKAQQLVSFQTVKAVPTMVFERLFQTLSSVPIKQWTYDASAKSIRVIVSGLDRTALMDLKVNLESLGDYKQIIIPLSALNAEQTSDEITLTLVLK